MLPIPLLRAAASVRRFAASQWHIVVGMLLIAMFTAFGIVAVNMRSDDERISQTRLALLEGYLYQVNVNEETAVAERRASPGIQSTEAALERHMTALESALEKDKDLRDSILVISDGLAYCRLQLHAEFALINAGKYAEAEQLASTRFDPEFAKLKMEIDQAQNASHQAVKISNLVADVGTVLALIAAAIVSMAMFRQYERVRLQAAEYAQATAEQANRSKSEFLSRMSHELRTPMNAVLGFAQLLQMSEISEDAKSDVAQILRAGKHLLSLIDEVLDIARIDAGKLQISLEAVRIGDVLDDAVQMMIPVADNRAISLKCDYVDFSNRYVHVDRQRIKQVLLNLLSNAIKYNVVGGDVTVHCAETVEGAIKVTVSDTGMGIPLELRDRLFLPFDRLNADSTGIEGTGLGLSLTKRLVELMDGKIGVESEVGIGSHFYVEFAPAPAPAPADCAGLHLATECAEETHLGGNHTVLYIEDNEANLDLAEAIFKRRPDIRLMTTVQGRLGIDLVREHRPDLVLLDLNLPDISGKQVLESLREDPMNSALPIVVISADAMPGKGDELLAVGANAYLSKPIDVGEMLSVLDEYLNAA